MVTMNNGSGFAQEVQVFFRTAQDLGRLRHENDRSQFEQTLVASGMDATEAGQYFDLVACNRSPSFQPMDFAEVDGVKSNSILARRLGIDLNNGEGEPPKNWLLYRLFQCFFPNIFNANYSGKKHLVAKDTKGGKNPQHRAIRFFALPVESAGERNREGNVMPIYRVVQGKEPSKFQAEVIRTSASFRSAFEGDLGMRFAELLYRLQMVIPSATIAHALARVIQAGRDGKEVTFAGAFCPDYAYEETGNVQVPFRYTFDGLGTGVGLVAQQFARIIPELSRFCKELGISHRFIIGMGDFEADAESVLQRVGVDRMEFVRRCQCSLDAFQELMPVDVPIELELFDAKRGKGNFRMIAADCTQRMMQGDFGMMESLHPDLHEVIARIPDQYRTFYERWYGVQMDDDAVRRIIYSQGGEYAAVGRIYYDDFGENSIFLAGDRPEMNRFNAFWAPLPVLCAKRAY
ncbi:MAG: hypothetical protein AAB649_06915 [Patescibacteria group bacterium]